jgi:hypothetical protein
MWWSGGSVGLHLGPSGPTCKLLRSATGRSVELQDRKCEASVDVWPKL